MANEVALKMSGQGKGSQSKVNQSELGRDMEEKCHLVVKNWPEEGKQNGIKNDLSRQGLQF